MTTQEILLPLFVEVILTFLLMGRHGAVAHARFQQRDRAAGGDRTARAEVVGADACSSDLHSPISSKSRSYSMS